MDKMTPKCQKIYHVKKGDLVEVISGDWKGEKGKIVAILKKKDRVVLELQDLSDAKKQNIGMRTLKKSQAKGPVFFRQERVTTYGAKFRIHKFRTMVNNADKIGTAVTVDNDSRITKVGAKLRDLRLDEFPQLFDVLAGNMSFVGTRPEVVKYVVRYTDEMNATLLMPAGITSIASIEYKDEAELLEKAEDADEVYVNDILPEKMKWNLKSVKEFGFFKDIGVLFKTVGAVLK